MADKRKMSVEEILAAARRKDAAGGASEEAAPTESAPEPESQGAGPSGTPSPEEAPAPAAPSGKKPGEMSVAEMLAAARGEKAAGEKPAAPASKAAEPAAGGPAKKPGEMSVADMLAAARGEKSAKPAPKPAKAAAAKPAAKAAAAPTATGAAAATGPKDTASILAAARTGAKPGPMSKAEAAAKAPATAAPKAEKRPVAVPPMPERPAYVRPAATPAPAAETRRGFFGSMGVLLFGSSLALGFSALAITHLLWLLGLARFMFPNILVEPPTRFKVGFPDDFAPGQVEERFKAQFGVWLVRYEYEGQPQLYALKAVCTHLGCTPNWLEGEQKFKCPCHGSGFYKDGVNFEGPAPRPLERYAIFLADDGQLEVDKSQTFNEELGQWRDPASFVPA